MLISAGEKILKRMHFLLDCRARDSQEGSQLQSQGKGDGWAADPAGRQVCCMLASFVQSWATQLGWLA